MLTIINKEFINSLPKTINPNNCWIPLTQPYDDGYCHIKVNTIRYSLHRLSMCVFNNINYYDHKIDTRHSIICIRSCFNPEHLKPGSCSDNIKDQVEHGVHRNSSKDVCPKCGNHYRKYRIKSGPRRNQYFRQWTNCKNEYRRKNYHGNS